MARAPEWERDGSRGRRDAPPAPVCAELTRIDPPAFARAAVTRMAQLRLPAISKLELFLTERCNLRCDYCFVADKHQAGSMTWQTAKRAVDWLIEGTDGSDSLEITLFGGEPLLRFSLIRRLVPYAREQAGKANRHIAFAVTTNGTLLTEEHADFAAQFGLRYLLSLDGDEETHDRHRRTARGAGTWADIVEKALPLLRRRQGWVGARMTVSPDAAARLTRNVRLLHSLGVNQFLIGPDLDSQWAPDQVSAYHAAMLDLADLYAELSGGPRPFRVAEFEESLQQREATYRDRWGCDAGRTRVAVSVDGSLHPCSRFVRPFAGMSEQFMLGDVWNGITEWRTRCEFCDGRASRRPACASCSYRTLCAGGCPGANLHMTGSIFTPSPFECEATRASIAALRRVRANRAKGVAARRGRTTPRPDGGRRTDLRDPLAQRW